MTRHQSIAHWPMSTPGLHGDRTTKQMHDTQAEANAWVYALNRYGFKGEGKIFPLSVRVEPVAEN